MFTVLIAEQEHIDAIRQENRLFFEPFLESKELAFCYWNPSGQTLLEAVPDLLDVVGRRKAWRAVIINNCKEEFLQAQNPFDVVDYSTIMSMPVPNRQLDPDEPLETWEEEWNTYYETLLKEKELVCKSALEIPLQKLVTWMCFRPEDYILNEVQEKQDVHDWAMEMIERDNIKASVRLEIMERNYYKSELRMKENMRRAFVADEYMNITYPSEIHCISLRTAKNGFFDPDTYWNVRQESDYSTFAERNMYFDKMRFLVFDLLPKTHRNYRNDYIRFLATVLIFSSNPAPSGALQTRHLYQLDVETDDTPLCTLVTSYDKKLASTMDVIENEMERIRNEIPGELTDKAASALFCTPKAVEVLLDASCDPDKVVVDNDYGFYYDQPEDEFHKWNRDRQTSEKELKYIVKQQLRSIRKSVSHLQQFTDATDVNISRLTPFQMDDIREHTNAAEDEMIASMPPDLNDTSRYTERMDEHAAEVKKIIGRRMTQQTGMLLSIICIALCVICFIPFVLGNTSTSKTISAALIVSAIILAALIIVMVVALILMRSSLRNAVRAYNSTVSEIVNEIESSLKQFSKYLSASYNVRKGHAVLNYSKKNLDEFTKSLRIRKKHLEDIRKRRAYLAEGYKDYFGDSSYCDETMARSYDYDFDLTTEYEYPAPFLAGDDRQIEFVSNGNFVSVPFSYVTKIIVRMEGIYDK